MLGRCPGQTARARGLSGATCSFPLQRQQVIVGGVQPSLAVLGVLRSWRLASAHGVLQLSVGRHCRMIRIRRSRAFWRGDGVGQHWVFSAMALAAGACLAAYALYAWRHRRASAGVSLAVVLAAAGWWSLAYALELAATNLPTKLLWGDAKWLGIALLPPAWYAFVMQYNGRGRWVNRRVMAALAVPPVAVVVLLANPATHDLVRYYPPSAAAGPEEGNAQGGALFWPLLGYADL